MSATADSATLPAASLLTVRGIVAGYGSVEVLHQVSLDVREGGGIVVLGGEVVRADDERAAAADPADLPISHPPIRWAS